MDNGNDKKARNQSTDFGLSYSAGAISKKTLICILIVLVAVVGIAAYLFYDKFAAHSERTTGNALNPIGIIETFEISALDYEYSDVIFENKKDERNFLFIKLEPKMQMYAVRYEGSVKMGIDGKEIKVNERSSGENKILEVTIPEAKIISHDAPLNDSVTVIYDIAKHTEKASIEQYTNLFNTYRKNTETKLTENGYLKKAQESAKKQLETFMNSIPDIRDNYTLEFVLK